MEVESFQIRSILLQLIPRDDFNAFSVRCLLGVGNSLINLLLASLEFFDSVKYLSELNAYITPNVALEGIFVAFGKFLLGGSDHHLCEDEL